MAKRPASVLWWEERRQLLHLRRLALLAVSSVFALFPIYWALNTSLKQEQAIISFPPRFLPNPFTLSNYDVVLTASTLPRNFLNSLIIGTATIALVLLVAVPAAYAASRHRFRGRDAILFVLLAAVMIPGVVTLIPQFFFAIQLGLHDTHLILVLIYSAAQAPMAVWVMKAFFDRIPRELDEAALVDGASKVQAMYRIMLPLSWPGVAAAAIVVFVWTWNEFILALTLTASDFARPVTVGLFFFIGEGGIQWGRITAAACLALGPVIGLFVLLRNRFMEGLTAGATKG